jgi:LacI family transcriptional regulator
MRLEGYKLAHGDYGVAIDPTLIREGQYTIASGYEQAKALLQLASMPDALFSSNHLMTIGCLRAILEAGINCPQQISLASFDDTGWFDLFRPSITAITQPAYDLGTTGAEFLLKRVKEKVSGPPRHVLLRGQMNVRMSTTPPLIEPGKVNTAQTDACESEKPVLPAIHT